MGLYSKWPKEKGHWHNILWCWTHSLPLSFSWLTTYILCYGLSWLITTKEDSLYLSMSLRPQLLAVWFLTNTLSPDNNGATIIIIFFWWVVACPPCFEAFWYADCRCCWLVMHGSTHNPWVPGNGSSGFRSAWPENIIIFEMNHLNMWLEVWKIF